MNLFMTKIATLHYFSMHKHLPGPYSMFKTNCFTILFKNLPPKSTVKTCLKRPLENRQNKDQKANGRLMKVESNAECSLGAFCNTFDLH